MEHLPASLTCQPTCLPISCPQVYTSMLGVALKLQGDNLLFHPKSEHLHTTSDPWKAESPKFLRLSSPTASGKANGEAFPHLNLRPEKEAILLAWRKR